MRRESMTPRERWRAVIAGKQPDRVPMDWWATPEVERKLLVHTGLGSMWDFFRSYHIDRTIAVEPRYCGPALPRGTDWFGCSFRNVEYGTGMYEECVHHPLAGFRSIDEIEENYRWPSPDLFSYEHMAGEIEGFEEYPVRGPHSEPFYLYKYLRGDEQAFVDLIQEPEMVEYILEKIFDYEYVRIFRTLEAVPGRLTYSTVAEDFGTQQGLLYSLPHIEKYFFPRMGRHMESLHQAGVAVMTHSDGAIRDAIPGLIRIGMDILNPIQWRCPGMEREGLKKDFGDRTAFFGAMDNQHTMPFGSVTDVRREVAENIDILGRGGGYILAPCHNIQPVTPVENILAMYEAGYSDGWY